MSEDTTKQANEQSASSKAAPIPSSQVEQKSSPSTKEPSKEKKRENSSSPFSQRRGDRNRRSGGRRNNPDRNARENDGPDLVEKVVFINRCAKVVKGGRRFSFSALVVVGDSSGRVAVGFGKANEVADSIRKANDTGRRHLETIALYKDTIPHEVVGKFDGGRVLLRPASPGTGIIAGGGVRAVIEAVGIKDILAKSLGSNNPANVVHATMNALCQLRNIETIYSLREKPFVAKKQEIVVETVQAS